MLEHALSDAVNWQTRKWSSYTKFEVLALVIINSNRKNLNQSENYPKYAHKMFEMLAHGTNWKTRHSMACQQTCKSSHKMDSKWKNSRCPLLTKN